MPPSNYMPAADAGQPSLSRLTGVRSGKNSYYVELRRTEARMTSAVRALEGISAALVRTRDDPRALLEEVLRTAAGHLHADWTMIALRDGELAGLNIRFLAVGPRGEVIRSARRLPRWLEDELDQVKGAADTEVTVDVAWVRVPMLVDGAVLGQLIARYQPGETVEHADLWVLRILANQAAVSMHTATLYAAGADMRSQAQRLYDQITRSSRDLLTRTAELEHAERHLQLLHQRELLDAERHRIALELHDSVAQYVLSAGLSVDVCRAEAADRDDQGAVQRLIRARDLIAQAGDQVRSVIYALNHESAGDRASALPELLQGLAAQPRPGLPPADVRIEGRPVPLGAAAEHGLARIAGEALFNASIHANATRAMIRLRYTPSHIWLWVSDDGSGDPAQLRRVRKLEAQGTSDGRHQGLANMGRRAQDLGGVLSIRRSKLGGVLIDVRIPVPGPGATEADSGPDGPELIDTGRSVHDHG